nr:helicase [Saccharomycopsis fibuligera]WOF72346.1 helicase [Saccharomycopsis fibuligera]
MKIDLFYKNNKSLEKYKFLPLFDFQNDILAYMHPENPYRSLISCFYVGSGKTYAAAALSHLYLEEGFKVLYLSHSVNSLVNFTLEYKKFVLDNRFDYLAFDIDTMTYSKFYNIRKVKNYGLIIMDEAHNLKDKAARYVNIKHKLDNMIYTKILIITATPMIDSINEIETIRHMGGEKADILFSRNKNNDTVNINYIGTKVGDNTLFLSKLKGKQLKLYLEHEKHKDSVFSNLRQTSISCSENYDPKIPLDEQSCKINRLVETLEDNKPTVIFCFYIKRGINFLIQVLESIGYRRFGLKGKKHYAVITGDVSSVSISNIINNYNKFSNYDGSIINVLIGSNVISESITLLNTRKTHILSPHWNFSHVEQSLGRLVRYGSHALLDDEDKTLDIYLHASYVDCVNNKYIGKDIDILQIATEKKKKIDNKLIELKQENDLEFTYSPLSVPEPDGRLIIKVKDDVWDLSKCFDTNKYKVSWCEFKESLSVGYDLTTGFKVVGKLPDYIHVNLPRQDGYTLWRSCVDNKLRLSYIIGDKKDRKTKRGKLLQNMNINDYRKIAKDINCNPDLKSIIETLKSQGRFIDRQISYDL